MKKYLLSVLFCMLALIASNAEEYTHTFTSKIFTANGTMTLSGVDWTLDGDGGYWGYDATKGQQFGSSGKPYKSLTLSTSGIEGKITKIVINTSGASLVDAYFTVSVGGVQYGSSTELTKTATSYTFEGSASGEILFSYTQTSSKAIYIKSITIVYSTGEAAIEAPVFSYADGTIFDESLSVEINSENTVYYSTDGQNYVKYTSALNITETTTLYAYAVNANGVSSAIVKAEYIKNELPSPDATEATLSFKESSQRTTLTSTQQVWKQNGVTFTNDKANSTNAVADYCNPVRCYKSSSITISAVKSFSKIVFDCGSVAYAEALAASVEGLTAQDDKVTVILSSAGTTYTIEALSGQVRLDAVTVVFATGDEEEGGEEVVSPDAPTFSIPSGTKFYPTLDVEISAPKGTIYYTLDGTDPTALSTEYSAPITLDATTTVKAIAVVDGVASSVATALYKRVPLSVEGSVADALEQYVAGEEIQATISGYIVGCIGASGLGTNGSNCIFAPSDNIVDTNILIADDADETDYTKCLPVQLPAGAVRTAFNLLDNPMNFKKKVVVEATLTSYFGIAGLKKTKVEGTGLYHSVSSADYATLYLGYKFVIPETVEAYVVKEANANFAYLAPIEGVVPANTGLILKGAGEHLFNLAPSSATADVEGNLLKGSLSDEYIAEEAYVLSRVDGEVGLYKAKMTDGKFLNNAFKAYLPASALPSAAQKILFLRLGKGTTGVENMCVDAEAAEEIFDLAGRRIKAVGVSGIYIIGGKKVFIRK